MLQGSPAAQAGGAASFRESKAFALPGWPTLIGLFVVTLALFAALVIVGPGTEAEPNLLFIGLIIVTALHFILYAGFTVVNPNDARALVRFGRYTGSLTRQGFWWVNPLAMPRRRISLRVRNFESSRLKVNERDGNPIEIAAIVVWRVVDSAEALFTVDDYEEFVKVQTEAALRTVATSYPYDAHEATVSLRGNPHEVGDILCTEIQGRLSQAGITVMDARLSHLAYAPEIANAMLRRQQANAVIAARTRIVEGAVGMVEMALDELSKKQVVTLDEERKAAMVSNLLVVLCSEHETQPVVNAGTLYQ